MKYTVIKNDDIDIDTIARTNLECVTDAVKRIRKKKGKKLNTYLVINTDELYADEVIDILKRNGHWC
jgi:hypothetical protein